MELWRSAQALTSINRKLSEVPQTQTQPSIYKVHKPLRDINPEAYEPQIIAIGPHHHDNADLKMMEEHKVRYLKSILQRKNENVERYISAVAAMEQEARNCYAEPISFNKAKFIEMLVLDGCFIIELTLKFSWERSTLANDPILEIPWMTNIIKRDLILFENQIPFFVLCKLYDLIVGPNGHCTFMNMLLDCHQDLFPVPEKKNWTNRSSNEVKHLLDLVHEIWRPSDDVYRSGNAPDRHNGFMNVLSNVIQKVKHLLNDDNINVDASQYSRIHSATALKGANVKFRKRESDSLFEVKFANGIIQMPPLTIDDGTECFFRNLIAYEQYLPADQRLFVTDYVMLLDCLINSPRDVEILSRSGIIVNLLGDDEVVAKMFNRIGDLVSFDYGKRFPYAETVHSINVHDKKRWNRACAVLNRDYFNSPWAYISFFAALLLLLLTVAQTVFSARQVN